MAHRNYKFHFKKYKPSNSHLEARPDKQFLIIVGAVILGVIIGVLWGIN